MIKRTVEISRTPAYVVVRNGQLVLQPKGAEGDNSAGDNAATSRRGVRARLDGHSSQPSPIPCEDIGVLLVDHPAVTYSHAALAALVDSDAAVVLCGRDHLPAGLLLPIGEHSQVVWRIKAQVSVKKPLHKQLWTQIVRAKIRAQAGNLLSGSSARSRLLALTRQVRSGDPSNLEAQAAKVYWAAWRDSLYHPAGSGHGSAFRRDPDGPPPNNLLNYGYAVLRAAVARALVAAGLLPALGIHHRQRSNAFCLADDLVEPLRPMVDARVRELVQQGETELGADVKRGLLELLTLEVSCGDQAGPLMVALHRYAASLVKCYEGYTAALEIPHSAGQDR